MIAYLNAIAALLTIAFGAFGFLAPRFTLGALDLETTRSNMGLSELRASVGGGFVVLGLYCLVTGSASAYLAMGVLYAGLTLGRFVSIALDSPPLKKAAIYGGIELILAAYLIAANWQS